VAEIVPLNNLIIAIVIGIILGNVVGVPDLLEPGTGKFKLLLEAGIVVMGARLVLSEVVAAGPIILALVAFVIAFTIVFVEVASSWLFGLDEKLGSLMATGSSICGVSAIVAVAGSVKAREEHIAYAVGTVLLFDALTLFAYPVVGTLLGLPDKVYGIWAGLSMFSTGPVTAAGFAYSDVAGQWATITKLTRNLFIGFAAIAYSVYYTKRGVENGGSTSLGFLWEKFPKFIFGFILFMMLASIGFFSAQEITTLKKSYSWLFVFAFAGLGLNMRLADLRNAGGKPVVLMLLTLMTVSSLTLMIVYTLFG
jgi:uncharacterized integral membrane protein (TIGR00698 family)